jgi:polysaccharide pyruvyl transferase WcaK-like protein
MRIGLLGQFGSGNLGNDGSLEAMMRFLRRAHPDVELVCICARPSVVSDNLGIEATGIGACMPGGRGFALLNGLLLGTPQCFLDMVETFRRTRGLDWMIVPGAGTTDDHRNGPSGWPFVLWRWCAAARLNGARIAFVGIGAEPVKGTLSRRLMKWAAGMASYRSYRDRMSRDFMAGIGLDVTRDPVVADIAFGLPGPEPQELAPRFCLTVGIGITSDRGWPRKGGRGGYEAYIAKLARFALRLLEQGHHLRLLTTDAGDWSAVEDFFRHLAWLTPRRFQTCITVEKAASLAELMQQMQETDVVVASRYHNVVCALKLGLPTISLSSV